MEFHFKFLLGFLWFLSSLVSFSLVFNGNTLRDSIVPTNKAIGAFFYLFSFLYIFHPYLILLLEKLKSKIYFFLSVIASASSSLIIIYFMIEIYNSQIQ